MSRFFVGQRVRVVRPLFPENYGRQARVERIKHFPKGAPTTSGVPLQLDADCMIICDDAPGVLCAAAFWQLEPILPEGHAPSVYSFEELMDKCRSGVVA